MNWLSLFQPIRLHSSQQAPSEDIRSAFEMDFDRIIFSHPFRRLQDKTQVHPMPVYDFVHNRLTHSLEVSSVARSLGKKVGVEIVANNAELKNAGFTHHDLGAIVAAAALAHDVGNPPFGHSGETAISDYFRMAALKEKFQELMPAAAWQDLINFEGNAQGFRILIRKEEGLKLTLPVLAAFTKYPRPSFFPEREKGRASQKKYGFFQYDQDTFHQIATTLGMQQVPGEIGAWRRHPLAFLVEAADDICYSIIDLEDGCGLGLVSYEETEALLAEILQERFIPQKLQSMTGITQKVAVLRALTINKLVDEAAHVMLSHEQQILSGTFDQPLIDLTPSAPILEEIRKISIKKIYRAQQVLEKEAAGFEVLDGLMHAFATAVYFRYFQDGDCTKRHRNTLQLLPEAFQLRLQIETDLYGKLLVITDFVSSMTDSMALKLFQIIRGIALTGR